MAGSSDVDPDIRLNNTNMTIALQHTLALKFRYGLLMQGLRIGTADKPWIPSAEDNCTITITTTTTTTSHRGPRTSQNPTAGPNSAASAPAAGGPITHLRARRRGLCRSADDTRSRSAVGPPQRTTTCLKL